VDEEISLLVRRLSDTEQRLDGLTGGEGKLKSEATRRILAESEELFRDTFETVAIGMALTSTEGDIIKVNQALCRMLGHSEEELLKANLPDISHPDEPREG
jgi:PAS domain-containing protein